MITSHKIKTLQCIFDRIRTNFMFLESILEKNTVSVEELEAADTVMFQLLEDVALWRVNYGEHFNPRNKGVKIRD